VKLTPDAAQATASLFQKRKEPAMSAPALRGYQHNIPVTPEGHERLSEQLRALIREREVLTARLRDARADGDPPSENAGLFDALDDHVRLEHRIATVESDLARARVIDASTEDGTATIGSRVRLRLLNRRGETLDYMLVSPVEAEPRRRTLSVDSPVGAACLGRRAGEIIEVYAPAGRLRFELAAVGNAGSSERIARRGLERERSTAPEAIAA
jgi:transcription elongation factor GreA